MDEMNGLRYGYLFLSEIVIHANQEHRKNGYHSQYIGV